MSFAIRRHTWLTAPVLACSLLVACGDDDESDDSAPRDSGVDSSVRPDSGNIDGGIDSSVAQPDGSTFAAQLVLADISPGDDAFYGVAHDNAGNIYAAGKTVVSGDDYAFVVAKYSASGALDTSFGTQGYAKRNVIQANARLEQARAIVVQSDGKIVVAGYAEHEGFAAGVDAGLLAGDADIYLTRFTTTGAGDDTFGTGGIVRLNPNAAIVETRTNAADGGITNTLVGTDEVWSLSQAADGKLVVHGRTRAAGQLPDGGPRTDTDFVLARFSANGQPDDGFGTGGVVTTDFKQTSASARAATVLPNGSIIGVGYSSNTLFGTRGTNGPQNPVLYKVNANGTPDPTFATTDQTPEPGIWHDFARTDQQNAEAYSAVPQGDKFVTLGYGPQPGLTGGFISTDWVWFRFNSDGSQDKSFGTQGQTFQNLGLGDNGRALVALPDNRLLGVGSGRLNTTPAPTNATEHNAIPTEALIGVLNENGLPDTTFGEGGLRHIDVSGGRNDALWGVAVSPDKKTVVAVGEGNNATAQDDRDGVVVIFPVP
ncbi:MAG TPA: hypothetical protein VFX59_16925 [Polyangiales bacterium]|nr:hypothetical protein [Polyangiales bacterium]